MALHLRPQENALKMLRWCLHQDAEICAKYLLEGTSDKTATLR